MNIIIKNQTMNEVALFKAVRQSKFMRDSSDEQLLQVIRVALLKLGIRPKNYPEKEELVIILDHIRMHFGNLPIDSFSLAFEMLIDGKLDAPDHFENFSCLYISKVMNAYKKWENRVAKEIPPPPLPQLPPPKITEEELINDAISLFKATGEYSYMSERLYEILEINPTDEEYKEAEIEATRIVLEKKSKKAIDSFVNVNNLKERILKGYLIIKKLKKSEIWKMLI